MTAIHEHPEQLRAKSCGKLPSRRHVLGGIGALAAGVLAFPSSAQRNWPAAPVRIVVGYGAGTAPDFNARTIARKLQETWTAGVVIDNRPGAGGTIAVSTVMAAPPDGLTLMWGTIGEMSISPAINRKLTVDSGRLRPIVELTSGEMAFVANPASPARNLTEYLAWAKDRKPLLLGTFGPGSPHHLLALLFGKTAGVPVEIVHYKGAQEFASDLRSGLIHGGFSSGVQARTWQQSNSVKVMGIAGTEPSRLFPDVQTFRQAGLERGLFSLWSGIFGPAGIPDNIAAQIHAACTAAMRSPEVDAAFREVGNRLHQSPFGAFERRVPEDRARFAELAQEFKLVVE